MWTTIVIIGALAGVGYWKREWLRDRLMAWLSPPGKG